MMRLFWIVLAVCMLPFQAMAKDKVFAVVPKTVSHVFFDYIRDGCRKADAELDGVTCEYIGPSKVDASEQFQLLQDLITRRVDGIAVAPVNAAALAGILKMAERAGIPLITIDSDVLPKDQGHRLAYIGTHNYAIGENLAKLVMKDKPEGGTVCIQSNTTGEANLNERLLGVRETLSGETMGAAPGQRLTGQNGWTETDGCPLYNTGDFTVTVKQMDEILGKYEDLDAFISVGAWPQTFLAAYRDVAQRYITRIENKDTIIAVADTIPTQMQILREGLGHGNVGQRPFEMGYKAVYTLKALSEGQKDGNTGEIYTGLDICTPANVETCLKREE